MWINGLQLALVSAVPLPTAVLSANFTGPGSRTAFLLYGVTYWLMATSFWGMWRYVHRRGLTDPSRDPERYDGVGKIYRFSIVWTSLCLVVAALSVYPAIVMWGVMFAVFAFPAEFAHFADRRRRRSEPNAQQDDQGGQAVAAKNESSSQRQASRFSVGTLQATRTAARPRGTRTSLTVRSPRVWLA